MSFWKKKPKIIGSIFVDARKEPFFIGYEKAINEANKAAIELGYIPEMLEIIEHMSKAKSVTNKE